MRCATFSRMNPGAKRSFVGSSEETSSPATAGLRHASAASAEHQRKNRFMTPLSSLAVVTCTTTVRRLRSRMTRGSALTHSQTQLDGLGAALGRPSPAGTSVRRARFPGCSSGTLAAARGRGPRMQCPQCHHENAPRAKFCEECANPLVRNCTMGPDRPDREVLSGVRAPGERCASAADPVCITGDLHPETPRRTHPHVEGHPRRRAQAGHGAVRGHEGLDGAPRGPRPGGRAPAARPAPRAHDERGSPLRGHRQPGHGRPASWRSSARGLPTKTTRCGPATPHRRFVQAVLRTSSTSRSRRVTSRMTSAWLPRSTMPILTRAESSRVTCSR